MAKKMDHEISCINIHPLKSSSEEEVESSSQFIALGLWTDMSIRLLQLPTLTQVQSHVIGGGDGTIPRSVLMISFDEDGGGGGNNTCMHYLMAALGDGQLFTFRMDPTSSGALSDKRKIILGSRPISLGTFKSISSSSTTTTGGNVTAAAAKVVENVFVASDRPTVIHCSNQKLIYSNVNLKVKFIAMVLERAREGWVFV